MECRNFFMSPRCEDVTSERDRLNKISKDLVTQPAQVINFNELNEKFKSRRISIVHHGITFECFYSPSSNCKLYIQLSSGQRNKSTPLKFERWTFFPYFDGIVINIDDPMYQKYPGIPVGWYYGDADCYYIEYLAEIVDRIKKIYCIKNEDIFFVGSSSAGYASLILAYMFEGSTAMAFNPQICLKNWSSAKKFEEHTNISLHGEDRFNRNDISYITNNTKSNFFIYVNYVSEKDWGPQLMLLCKNLCFIPDYGLSRSRNFTFFISHILYSNPHGTQIPKEWMPLIEATIFSKDIEKYKPLFRILSETMNLLYLEKDKNTHLIEAYNLSELLKENFSASIMYDNIHKNTIHASCNDIDIYINVANTLRCVFYVSNQAAKKLCIKYNVKNHNNKNIIEMRLKSTTDFINTLTEMLSLKEKVC